MNTGFPLRTSTLFLMLALLTACPSTGAETYDCGDTQVTTLTGSTLGFADGTSTTAQFHLPLGITSVGTHLYVVDNDNENIRKVTTATGAVTTLAGSGEQRRVDGFGAEASFDEPKQITTDGVHLYVSENQAIRKVAIDTGEVTTMVAPGTFQEAYGVVAEGPYLYVADYGLGKVMKVVIATGEVTMLAAGFSRPRGLATDGTHLYVSSFGTESIHKIVIATGEVTLLAGSGTRGRADGTGKEASFSEPTGLATDGTHLYVADFENTRIRKIVIATGKVTTIAGSSSGYADGPGKEATFSSPNAIVAVGASSDGVDLYVSDGLNARIRKVRHVPGVCANAESHAIGGQVQGLTGTLVLQNNGGDDKTITEDGVFVFSGTVASGKPYDVTVATQPDGQVCTVENGSGTAEANVDDIVVSCVMDETDPPSTSASVEGGTYNEPQQVALTCDDGAGSGCAETYYTVDGSTPTTDSTVYTAPIAISTDTTLQFFSVDKAGNQEAVQTVIYQFEPAAPQLDTTLETTPADPSGADVTFTFSSPQTDTIEYKLDDAPFVVTTGGTASYTGLLDGSHTFTVRAVQDGFADPTPATFTWVVDTSGSTPDTVLVTIGSHATGATIVGTRSIVVTAAVTVNGTIGTVSATHNGNSITATLTGDTITVPVTLGDRANLIIVRAETTGGASHEAGVELHYPFATFASGVKAEYAIGQPNLTSGASGTGLGQMDTPYGPALLLNGTFYLNDTFNNRILGFYSVPATFGATADFVLGQDTLTGTAAGTSASRYTGPGSISAGEGKVFVADYDNNRVLIYNSQPVTTGAAADVVVGQANFTSSGAACSASGMTTPEFAFAVDGKLIVADGGNNRVLIWNTIPTTNGVAADIVLGQLDMTTCDTPASPNAQNLLAPAGIWSDGTRLLVAEVGHNRILIWDTFPTSSGQLADGVLGQLDFASSASGFKPYFITSNGNQLFVGDITSYQVHIWNSIPTAHVDADQVVGSGFSGTDADKMASPNAAVLYGDRLFVTDGGNHRVLIFRVQ